MFMYLPGPPGLAVSVTQFNQTTQLESGTYCWYPRWETSEYIGNTLANFNNVAKFTGHLDDVYTYADYTGRKVKEAINITSGAGCSSVDPSNSIPEVTNMIFLDAGTWDVTGTTYADGNPIYDGIQYPIAYKNYLQGLPGFTGCNAFTGTQDMYINSCANPTNFSFLYDHHYVSFDVGVSSVTGMRGCYSLTGTTGCASGPAN